MSLSHKLFCLMPYSQICANLGIIFLHKHSILKQGRLLLHGVTILPPKQNKTTTTKVNKQKTHH